MCAMPPEHLPFSVDLILESKKRFEEDKWGSDFIVESLVLPKTALLMMQSVI
jgi:hypothetical protein